MLTRIALCLAFIMPTFALHGQETFLLSVDATDLSAVVISATGESNINASTDLTIMDGVTLTGFFTSPGAADEFVTSSTLVARGATTAYDSYFIDDFSGSFIDLNLYYDGGEELQNFDGLGAAFGGILILDLTGFSVPAPGFTGDIIAGYHESGSGTSGPVIGSYQVIPEPGTVALVAGMLALCLVGVRRRFS